MDELYTDIRKLRDAAFRKRMIPLVRLNGTSDIPWENVARGSASLMKLFPFVQFYDYTKSVTRMRRFLYGELPANYHLTFSRSECNNDACYTILSEGGNVAIVFSTRKGAQLPATWNGYRVIDGDVDDARPSDNQHGANGSPSIKARGVVIGLRAKGKARHDTTGFVIQVGGYKGARK